MSDGLPYEPSDACRHLQGSADCADGPHVHLPPASVASRRLVKDTLKSWKGLVAQKTHLSGGNVHQL